LHEYIAWRMFDTLHPICHAGHEPSFKGFDVLEGRGQQDEKEGSRAALSQMRHEL